MALNFPNSPTNGQLYTDSASGNRWVWDSGNTCWVSTSTFTQTITVASSAPGSPVAGQLWWNKDYGRLLVYYTDDNTSQWVDASPSDYTSQLAYNKANNALANTSGVTFAGNLTITGNVTVSSNTISIAGNNVSPYGMKNKIINGDMRIWQRSTAPASGVTAWTYNSVDRWIFSSGGTNCTISRSTTVPTGFQYSLKLQRTPSVTGTGNHYALQIIESVNCIDLQGKDVTFSFWAKAGANFSASSSSIIIGLQTGTVADEGSAAIGGLTGMTIPINTTQAITTTWTRYTFTGTIPTNTLEMNCYIGFTPTGTAGADDSVYITGVQIESGPVATPFEFRHYGTELALCKRYYWQIQSGTAAVDLLVNGYNYQTNQWESVIQHPVEMRTAPLVTYTAANTFVFRTGTGAPSILSYYASDPTLAKNETLIYAVCSGQTQGWAQALMSATGKIAGIYFSAEL